MEAHFRDLRYALRVLGRAPGFTLTVVLTLGLGIGVNSAVFSAIDTVLFKPLPFPDADRLVRIHQITAGSARTNIPPTRLEDWNALSSSFVAISGYFVDDVVDTTGDLPERLIRAAVAPRFFDVLGVQPGRGRSFAAEEYRFGGPTAVLLSDRLWQSRGADPALLDAALRTGGQTVTIVGVAAPLFRYPDRGVDIWTPSPADAPYAQSRNVAWYTGIGRLEPDVSLEEAQADLRRVQAQLAAQYPDTDRGVDLRLEPLKDTVVGGARGSLWLLFGAVSVLLLIVCINVAALLLSRSAQREPEIAVRYSLGASGSAVISQLLTEAIVLALGAAALGLLVALGVSKVISVLAPELPRLDEVAIDARILLYTLACAVVVAVLCGVFPALRSARRARYLPEAVPSRAGSRHHSLQWLLVGAQVALAVVLLAGAGLLFRSIESLSRVDPGFRAARVLAFHVAGRFGDEGAYGRVVERINATLDELVDLPGIEAVAITSILPSVQGRQQEEFELVEGRADTEPLMIAERRTVSPGYFATLRIPLLAGELCRRPADALAAREVMVNKSFVDRYFPDRSALGLHLVGETSPDRIVGIVGDVREVGMDRDPLSTVYRCYSAPGPAPWYLVRTSADPMAVAGAVRLKLKELEPLRPVYDLAPLEERIDDASAQYRLRTFLLVFFAGAALSLALLGIYGTLSYIVSLRAREIGLRMALGAQSRHIIGHYVAKALRVVGGACVTGLVLSLACSRALSGALYGVSPSDPVTLSAVVAVILAAAALAAFLPALRASRVHPLRSLRQE